MEHSENPGPTTLSRIPKFLTTVTPFSKFLAAILFIILPFLGFYLGIKYPITTSLATSQSSGDTKTETVQNDSLLSDIKKLGSQILVSDWKTKYAVFLRYKDSPVDYSPFGQNGGLLSISEDLVILNLETGERIAHELPQGIMPLQMVEFLKEGPLDGYSHYRLYAELLRWSPFSENVFWGKLSIYSNGDPPVANEVGLFKMDIKNGTIDSYALPSHGLFGSINEKTNSEKVLYESLDDGLSLYLYDLKSKQNRLLVTYNKSTFDKYCSGVIEYVYNTTSFYGDCGRERGLMADWNETGISYFDFVNRNVINVSY